MPVEIWFPTVVFHEDIAVEPAVRSAALDAVRDRVATQGADEEIGLTASGTAHDLHLDARVAPLLDALRPAVARFLFEVMLFDRERVEFHVGRCWPVVQRGTNYGGNVHHHRGAVFSAVFFLQVPPGSGPLALYKPNDVLYDGLPKKEESVLTWTRVTYEAVESRLVLFSSELRHNRQPNTTALGDARIAIAFDLFALSDLDAAQSGMPRIDAWKRFP